jgi:hypothetical protein
VPKTSDNQISTIKLYAAEIGVSMSTDVVALPNGQRRLAPPRLTDFFVDELVRELEMQ